MFVATIDHITKGGNHHLGSYVTERQAAIAYDIFAKTLHGEFARLNIPDAPADEVKAVQGIINDPKHNFRHTTSRYVGVGWHKVQRKWRARIGQHQVGMFRTELEAVYAYNREAAKCGRVINQL